MTPAPGLRIIQHHAAEGPGEFIHWAEDRGLRFDVFRADHGALPPVDGGPLILLGGPYSVPDALDGRGPTWLRAELEWISRCLQHASPVFAVCLGAQILAAALGARVHRLPRPELGWTRVRFPGSGSPIELDMLQWHDDAFELPPRAASLASSDAWPHQMFEVGRQCVGMQFHPEWNAMSVHELHAGFGVDCPLPRASGEADRARFADSRNWLWQRLDQWMAATAPG